jgi:ArsR family transcriptional regulator
MIAVGPKNVRELDASHVEALAGSIARQGMLVQIVDGLRRSAVEVCQCELVPLFGVPQSTLSHQIKKLVDAGLVAVERRHKWAYHSLSANAVRELTRAAIDVGGRKLEG